MRKYSNRKSDGIQRFERTKDTPRSRKRKASFAATLYATTTFFYVDLVGRLMVSELVAIAGLFNTRLTKRIIRIPHLRSIIFGYGVFLIALMVSDYYNASTERDFLRGWASIVVGAASTLYLTAYFLKHPHSAVYAYLFAVAGFSLFFNVQDLDIAYAEESSNHFKVAFVPVLLPGVTLTACVLWSNNRFASAFLLFSAGLVFIMFDARSSGGGLVVAALLLMAQIYGLRPRVPEVLVATILMGSVAYGGYVLYVEEVLYHGLGGSNAKQLERLENPYNPLELLLFGRASVVVAGAAIEERPFFGFGSWARDETGKYGFLYGALRAEPAYDHPLGIIPAHSMLLAAWVWAGVFGFVGMAWVGITMLRLFLLSFWAPSSLAPALNVSFVAAVWSFFFSPVGHIRTSFPVVIALLIAAAYSAELPRCWREKVTRSHAI